jgi:predicted enzyme related to lactoylglutathione lyase
MPSDPVFLGVDSVTIPVPDLDAGLSFYGVALGHGLLWRNDEVGQAGLALPDSSTEIVLSTRQGYSPSWLVTDVDQAADAIVAAGGTIVAEPFDIPVGRLVVVADPFGNVLVLLDLSRGRYVTDAEGRVTRVEPDSPR